MKERLISSATYRLAALAIAHAVTATLALANQPATQLRTGYRIDVTVPIKGDQDEMIRRQVEQIAGQGPNATDRPIVVLVFQSSPGLVKEGDKDRDETAHGSQFERCLALARFLSSPSLTRLRLVAYVPESIEGHAVLPLLACEEIYIASNAEMGRAAIGDTTMDAAITGAYSDVINRRHTLPLPAVMAMLRPDVEVVAVRTLDGENRTVSGTEAAELRRSGTLVREDVLWPGGGLASFSGAMMRQRQWVATANDISDLSNQLGLATSLKKPRNVPKQWHAAKIELTGNINTSRVNQIIRGINESIRVNNTNLIFVNLDAPEISYQEASRLGSFIAELDEAEVVTVGVIGTEIVGPAALVPLSCRDAILLADGKLTPANVAGPSYSPKTSRSTQLVLANIQQRTERPSSLLSVLLDKDIAVKSYIDQSTGRIRLRADWEPALDSERWLAKETVAGGRSIDRAFALQHGLVDAQFTSQDELFASFGLESPPTNLKTPWLDASIQRLLANGWIPRVLLMIGFFALMVELGSPGIGLGGLIAALSFLGFFWIEGLNGNVEWLEILLFLAGVTALAIELFVLPGFGVFGIAGLLMVLVSIVLASQTFIWPTNSDEFREISINLFWVACLALGGMIGLLVMHKQLERLPMFRWVALQPLAGEELSERESRESLVHWEHLIGQEGITTTRLNPSGKAQFGRNIVAVVGSGGLIGEGTPVRVAEVRGNLVIVEEIL